MRILVSGSTRSVREVAALYPNHVGHLTTPANGNAPKTLAATGLPWAIDNGAFTGFDAPAFCRLLGKAAGLPNCLFVVAPDVVADARTTLRRFLLWEPIIRECGFPVAYVLQDGLGGAGVPWRFVDAVFIGGTTEFKFSAAVKRAVAQANELGKHVHLGRCNTLKRLAYAHSLGCDSVDGSCFSRWADDFLLRSVRFIHQLDTQKTLLDGCVNASEKTAS